MNSKIKLIIIGAILIFILIIVVIFGLIPKVHFTLNGDTTIFLQLDEEYKELNATANVTTFFYTKELKYEVNSNIDTSKIGEYEVVYTTNYKNKEYKKVRNVIVKDTIKPEIKVNGQIKGCKKNNLIEMDVTAYDNYDGNISDKINYRVEDDKIYLTVADNSQNEIQLIEKITYIDNEKPVIKLNGNSKISLYVGEKYEEFGATATDSCDGDLTKKIKIQGKVDTNTIGTYTINYSTVDSSGNESSIQRTISVLDKKIETNENIIYLTFDDGPGPYTEQLLDILSKNNIKATFFVTNQFPKYQYIIKKEYEQGHTVGIHTYSHKWTVYSSVDTYLEDFNKMENIVFTQTGEHSKLFRFPGGSSNTVSKKYSKGIMTELTTLMQEKGYVYFDWNFDSGDTSKNKNSKENIIKTVKSYLSKNGSYIILMHDIKKNTIAVLPEIIEYAKNHNYTFKKLDSSVPAVHFKVAN